MQIAIMQPYFLPYLGYFQLMAAVDKFVVLDDVNFINKGWINRNRLLLNGRAHTFTVPLKGASQNRRICDIDLVDEPFWREKLLKTIRQAYAKAPCFDEMFSLIEHIVNFPARQLNEFLLNSLREMARTLQLSVDIVESSRSYGNADLKAQARIIDICKREGATTYVNAIGGTELYDRQAFAKQGIGLHFLQPYPVDYPQNSATHVPWLSMLDVLMFNPVQIVRDLLHQRELV
jgi:hypothetical protein